MITEAERRLILQNALMLETSQGNRIAWVGAYEAHVWRMPTPINHVLHGVLSLVTFGLWLLVWLLVVACQPKPLLVGVGVDPYGQLFQFNAYAALAQGPPVNH